MKDKKYYFMAGLPRSGSTLLRSILNQNDNIHAAPNSPVLELMHYTEKYFKVSEQYNSYPKPRISYNIISNFIDQYYEDIDCPIIIDSCRAWPNNIEKIKTYITEKPKIICNVRDILEILASFITLINKNKNKDQLSFIDRAIIDKKCTLDDENRCKYLMSSNGIVEQSLWAFRQAFVKNDKKYLLIIEYNDLVNNPEKTLKKIYDFLEVDYFSHDFENIKNSLREEDTKRWGLDEMHYVRKKIEKISKNPHDVLPKKIIDEYKNLEFWRQY